MFSGTIDTKLSQVGSVELPFGKYYDLIVDWKFVLITCAVYLLAVNRHNAFVKAKTKALNTGSGAAGLKKYKSPFADSKFLKILIFTHNVSLSIFSGKVFVSVISNWLYDVMQNPLAQTYCDTHGRVWNNFMFYWAWAFYLSKYYEFIDTLIIMLKGRKITTLQSYHHAGAVVSMWLIIVGQAAGSWAFVMFNSFVHTIMYCYYASTTLGIKPPYKSLLTTLQIVQFALGVPVSLSYLLVPNCLRKREGLVYQELGAYFFVALYLVPLMHMFINFARATFYPKNSPPTDASDAAGNQKVHENLKDTDAQQDHEVSSKNHETPSSAAAKKD